MFRSSFVAAVVKLHQATCMWFLVQLVAMTLWRAWEATGVQDTISGTTTRARQSVTKYSVGNRVHTWCERPDMLGSMTIEDPRRPWPLAAEERSGEMQKRADGMGHVATAVCEVWIGDDGLFQRRKGVTSTCLVLFELANPRLPCQPS